MMNFKERRTRLLQTIGDEAIAIIPAAKEKIRSHDVTYYFRQSSDFYYLTGFAEPEAIAIFVPNHPDGEYIFFNRSRDPAKELWEGERAGQEGACEIFGADAAFPFENFAQHLLTLLQDRRLVYYDTGLDPDFDHQLLQAIHHVQTKTRAGIVAPEAILSLSQIIHEWRLIKNPDELTCLRKASTISAQAHKQTMRICKPGMMEYELEAELLKEFYRQGCRSTAYSSIVAGGKNACVLHYVENQSPLKANDLVLIDAGGEYQMYAADITRTFPVNGKFSARQKAIYEIVLSAQLKAIEQARMGVLWSQLQESILSVITQGLIDLKILQGSLDDLIEQKAYLPFYMHNSGHWLGLDVHDVGQYKIKNKSRQLQPGMVITIEPGIYIAQTPQVDSQWHNIGIRIEDDIHITHTQPEILSKDAPKTIAEIENWMAS